MVPVLHVVWFLVPHVSVFWCKHWTGLSLEIAKTFYSYIWF
jgi:hypothetical protein